MFGFRCMAKFNKLFQYIPVDCQGDIPTLRCNSSVDCLRQSPDVTKEYFISHCQNIQNKKDSSLYTPLRSMKASVWEGEVCNIDITNKKKFFIYKFIGTANIFNGGLLQTV